MSEPVPPSPALQSASTHAEGSACSPPTAAWTTHRAAVPNKGEPAHPSKGDLLAGGDPAKTLKNDNLCK